jgi:Na+/H+ antiporter NhaC
MQFGPESLLPPLIAIVLAVVTRRVLLPLACGVMIGAALLATADPTLDRWATPAIFFQQLFESVFDRDHLRVVAFTLLLGAMVGVLELGGAMHGLIDRMSRRIRTRRGGQTMIAGAGLLIFFDDYANSLLIGGTMRPTADRFGISREKLAYLVDSTAAPVAGLSLISTWAAVELDYIATGLAGAGIDQPSAALSMFIASIPYRFYAWFAITTVFIVALSGRDWGPMAAAEQRATERIGDPPVDNDPSSSAVGIERRHLWIAAVLPIVGCVTAVVASLIITGASAIDRAAARDGGALRQAIEVLGNGDAYFSLIVGSGLGLSISIVCYLAIGHHSFGGLMRFACAGAFQMTPAILILWFAWALSAMTAEDQLNTGRYLASLLTERLDVATLPTIVFVISGAVAFATGTSWGTMAILTPLSIELAFRLTQAIDPDSPLVLATCGSVLAGAIFGDHCSPISDTTVLSSRASGCDHVAHVRTQMPYALLAAAISIAVGTWPAAWGVSPWISLIVGTAGLVVILRFAGQTTVKQ